VSALLGLALGLGLTLCASPALWPRPERLAEASVRRRWLRTMLAQAGLDRVPATAFLATAGITGVAAFAVLHATTGVVVIAVTGGALGLLAPFIVLSSRARRHRRSTRTMWPDVVDLLLSGVRAGLGLPDALGALAHSAPAPLRHGFEGFERDFRVHADFGAALDRAKERFADPTADRILETLRMAREVGGNRLGVVLRSLSAQLRTDAAIRLEVEARQSWVVGAARIGVAAPWLVLVLLATRPEAAAAYNSSEGSLMVAIGLIVTIVAYRVMLAVGRLPEPRRWFA